ncbi:MAG: sialidase family protein [Verrucomicrobiota bacterium]
MIAAFPRGSHADEIDREKLPRALRQVPLERLSSGTYSALTSELDLVQFPRSPGAAALGLAVSGATLDPKIGANIRLGDDPELLPATLRAQAEPHLVRSWSDPNLIVGIFQEGRYTDGGAVDCGYGISTDAGQTWNRGLIPHLSAQIDGGPFNRASDPVAGIDLNGHIYLNTLCLKGEPASWLGSLVISKSVDGGKSFSRPLVAFASDRSDIFPDKNWMAINTFAGTPTANRIVITFTEFRYQSAANPTTTYPIVVTYSDDGGASWSAPKRLARDYVQGSQPVFLPDGKLIIAYWNFLESSIEVQVSPDGGANFDSPRTVTRVFSYADPVARSPAFLFSAIGDRETGSIYLAYQARMETPRIMMTRSSDRGETWTTPVAVNDTPNGASVFLPAIAASPDGQHVTVIFYDKRDANGNDNLVDLYLAESFDGGNTWQPNLRISESSSDLRLAPLTPMGRMLGDYLGLVPALNFEFPGVALWIDTRTQSPDPFASIIRRTSGATFATWQSLRFSAEQRSQDAVVNESGDPDGDGIPNLLEYALAMDPNRAQASPVTLRNNAENTLAVSVSRNSLASDVRLVWRASTDFKTWLEVSPQITRNQLGPFVWIETVESVFPLTHRFQAIQPGAAR